MMNEETPEEFAARWEWDRIQQRIIRYAIIRYDAHPGCLCLVHSHLADWTPFGDLLYKGCTVRVIDPIRNGYLMPWNDMSTALKAEMDQWLRDMVLYCSLYTYVVDEETHTYLHETLFLLKGRRLKQQQE
jgi:hypothetical protein